MRICIYIYMYSLYSLYSLTIDVSLLKICSTKKMFRGSVKVPPVVPSHPLSLSCPLPCSLWALALRPHHVKECQRNCQNVPTFAELSAFFGAAIACSVPLALHVGKEVLRRDLRQCFLFTHFYELPTSFAFGTACIAQSVPSSLKGNVNESVRMCL